MTKYDKYFCNVFFPTDVQSHFLMIFELNQYLSKQKNVRFIDADQIHAKKILLMNIILNRSCRTILFNVKTSGHLFFLTGVFNQTLNIGIQKIYFFLYSLISFIRFII